LFSGESTETRSNGLGDGLISRLEIFVVKGGQTLGVESLIHFPDSQRWRKAVFLNQLPQLPVDDFQEESPFAEAPGQFPQIDSSPIRQSGFQEANGFRDF